MTAALAGRVWADHGGALRTAQESPWLAAVLWGAAALALGVAIVAINVVVRRRSHSQ